MRTKTNGLPGNTLNERENNENSLPRNSLKQFAKRKHQGNGNKEKEDP
jgi:hypothetical protein